MTLDRAQSVAIKTPRLFIRPVKEGDLADIYAIHSVEEVNRHIPYQTWETMEDAKAWLAMIRERQLKQEAGQFVISNNDGVIGTIIIFNYHTESGCLEIGYVLAQSVWRQGYMKEALDAFIPRIVELLALSEIKATVESENRSSGGLLISLGFTLESKRVEADGTEIRLFRKTTT